MMTVELVSQSNCPNAARINLRRALTEAGLAARWTESEASSDPTPAPLRHYGSPTVLVNGRDVADSEPSDGVSCRVYNVAGVTSGAPPVEWIVRALVAGKQQEQRGGWRRVLLVLPAIGTALVPGLTCPACWPGYAALLSTLGIGFIPTAPYLLPLTAGFLVIALAALAFRAESRVPLVLGLVAALVVLLGKFVFASSATRFVGVGLLLAASLSALRRGGAVATRPACASCEVTRPTNTTTPAEGR